MEQVDILKAFGGEDRNSLLTVLNVNSNNDNDFSPDVEQHSPTKYYNVVDTIDTITSEGYNFSILSLNIQSLNAKFDQLNVLVHYLSEH